MKITVTTSGVLQFWDGLTMVAQMLPYISMQPILKARGIRVFDNYGRWVDVYESKLVETEILPAAPVPFTGSVADIWQFLAANATVLESGIASGIVNDSNVVGATVKDALNNLSTGGGLETNILAKGVNYSISTSDYIIYATANNITLRLPTIGALLGQRYKIFANNRTITVACDDPSGDRITGLISVQMKKWDSATFRALYSNQWLIE